MCGYPLSCDSTNFAILQKDMTWLPVIFEGNCYHCFSISYLYLNLLYLYPGFYSYTEGAIWKILDLFVIIVSSFHRFLISKLQR